MKSGFETKSGNESAEGEPASVSPSVEEIAKLFPQLEILELLGRGGMGAVYKARQPRLNRFVALKILSPEKRNDPQFAERFEREARALAWLSHPNIVTVYDFGEVQGHFYLLMEFVGGLSLRQLLQARKLSPAEALGIVPKICEALQYAHEQGVIHRDIKPENILLDKKGQVKIADFGIAKIMDLKPGDLSLTGAKDVVGTPHYMAPEQIEKPQAVDRRADIYSLGVVFYEMLTGELPLGKFPPPSQKVQIDVRLDEVVLRALEKEPERRYQQASEVKTDVETIVRTTVVPANAGVAGQAMPAGDYTLDIGSCLRRGWLLVRSDFWPVVGVTLLVLLVTQAASSTVAGIILAGPLLGGLCLYYLKKIRSEPAGVGTAFSGFSIAFLQLFLAALVPPILIFLGFLCLILPGVYLAVAWIFTLALVVDKRLDFGPAMKLSRKTVSRHWWKFFGFILVLALLNLVGVLCCFVGSLVIIPVTFAALAYAYEDIFGSGAVKGGAPASAPVELTPTGENQETVGGRGKIVAPAVALMAAATVKLFSSTVTMKHFLMGWGLHFSSGWRFFVCACITLFMIVPALLVLFGAVKMMRLQGHKWAIAAAILALAFPPWFLIGVPAGIWALVVLCGQKVKQAFAYQSPPARMWPWFWGTALGAFLVVALALGLSTGSIGSKREVRMDFQLQPTNSITPVSIKTVSVPATVPVAGPALNTSNDVSRQTSLLVQEGWLLCQARKWDEAAAKFNQAVQVAPRNADAWNGLGWAEFDSGKTDEAEKSFQQAIALDTNQPGALNGLGQIYLSQQKYDEAEKFLLKAAPQAPAAWYGLARLYLLKGNFVQAEKWAQNLLDSGQADDLARQMLKAAQTKHLSESLRFTIEPHPAVNPANATPITMAGSNWQELMNSDQRLVMEWTDRHFRSYLDTRTFDGWSLQQRTRLERRSIDTLTGPHTSEYYRAINTLAALHSVNALPALRQIAFDRRQKDNRDRWMAVRALGIIGDKQAVPELIHLLYHYNVNTRWWAQISLVRLTGRNFSKDWAAWGNWWNSQNGQPPFDSQIIRWSSNQPESDKLEENLAESDHKFLESIEGGAT
jgi:tetratricopeptide (TPR) repeat protein/tRNA A-37 threonylcarbamoyl transferase component Bud32